MIGCVSFPCNMRGVLLIVLKRVKALEGEMAGINANVGSQMNAKDELIRQLQDQVTLWRNKYEALAKLYSQLRTEHLEMLSKHKQMQLKANSAQEAIDKMERMEKDVKAKNLELADMIRERDRARFDLDRVKSVGLSRKPPICSNSNCRIRRRSWIGCEEN
jgi:huntingtin-interacting protein 1-related protein